MIPTKFSPLFIGRWFMTDEGDKVQALEQLGNLVRCRTDKGIVLIPVFDLHQMLGEPTVTRKPRVKKEKKPGKSNKRAIVSIDKDGNEHAYPSISEAAVQLKLSPTSIHRALQDCWRTSGGMQWRYV